MNAKTFVKKYTMVIALVVVFILFAVLTQGRLLYPQNLSNLLLQNAYVLVMACGMLLCILTGGNIDLSVGSTVCLIGAIAAQLMAKQNMNAIAVIVIGLLIACAIGVWQGFWIGYIHIPPFICTLSGMFLFRGLGRAILGSKTVAISNKTFLNIFASYINIPGLDGDVKWSAFIVGIIASVLLLASTAQSRAQKAKKGYKMASAVSDFGRVIIIGALVLYYTLKFFIQLSWLLCQYSPLRILSLFS